VTYLIKKKIANAIQTIKMEFIHNEKKISDNKLLPELRTNIHVLEKRLNSRVIDYIKIAKTYNFYMEAKKRNLLSIDELEWCDRVLFGKNNEECEEYNDKISSKEVLGVIKNRRSVRSWKNENIKRKTFEVLIEAAKWAPSSCNRQPWQFTITEDRIKIKTLSVIKKQNFIEKAPYCILVSINKKAWSDESGYNYFSGLDAGAAIQNLLLQAEKLRLGACWVNWNPNSVSKIDYEKVKKMFSISDDFEIISIIPIGKPNEKPSAPGRKKTEDIVRYSELNNI
jgi:nitroreductase